jgi:aldose 1-epimerase
MQIGFRSPGRLRTFRWARIAIAIVVVLLGTSSLALAARQGHKPSHPKSHGQSHGKSHGRGHGSLSISKQSWGTANGQAVDLYTLSNSNGMMVKITNYGGVVQSIWVPDRKHKLTNVALGFPNLSDYVNDFQNQPWPAAGGSGDTYFGAIIGRYANRIAGAEFSLNGTNYPLGSGPPCPTTPTPNNGSNLLHGGPNSYNTQVWSATTSSTSNAVSLILTYTDPNCKNGFPGTVQNTVTYTLDQNNSLGIAYKATTDKPTVVNFTNHTYFNLAGEGSGDIYGEKLAINSDTFTPVDNNLIPTGFASVAGTPFDFRAMKPIGRDIRNASAPQGNQLTIAHGYDHNWVLKGSGNRLASVAQDPNTGIALWTYTTEPGVQVYTGNFLVGDLVGTSGHAYRQGDAFTLETQHYPDSPHHQGDPQWPSVVLNPGQTFNSSTTYRFSTAGPGFRHNF